jgi:hypothetical protein
MSDSITCVGSNNYIVSLSFTTEDVVVGNVTLCIFVDCLEIP